MKLDGSDVTGESYYTKFRVGNIGTQSSLKTLEDIESQNQEFDWKLHVDEFSRTSADAGRVSTVSCMLMQVQ